MKTVSAIFFSGLLFWTPQLGAADIYSAIENNDLASISQFSRSNNINVIPDASKGTLLNYAIKKGKTDAAVLLIDSAADLNAMSDDKTPLMYAAKYNRVEIAKLLIAKGAPVNLLNSKKQTALIYAAKYGAPEVAQALIAAGADLRAKDYKQRTAYDRAIKGQKDAVARLLYRELSKQRKR